MDLDAYLLKTVALMEELRLPVRDTYSPSHNLDDFHTNGRCYNGPRQLKIEWIDTAGIPEMKGKIYHIPPLQSAAYDAYSILMPLRYGSTGRDDPIIHELVHFLQHNTSEEDSQYVKFTGQNYPEYLGQRVELEAHAVQVLYILRQNPTHRDEHLTATEQDMINRALSDLGNGSNLRSAFLPLLLCKARQLI